MLELFLNGADETSPLIVAIHGMGGVPDNWIATMADFPKKAQVVMPRAPTPHAGGYSWFTFRDGMTDDQFGVEVGSAEEHLWPALADVAGAAGPRARKMLVMGFSQGAFLSFAIASRHGDRVFKAFPISGSCPGPLLPKTGPGAVKPAPIVAFHGTADDVVEIKWGRAAVHGFVERGGDAVLREYPGIGHSMSREMRADLFAELERALA
jgi:phospholipase/carboxylesterase